MSNIRQGRLGFELGAPKSGLHGSERERKREREREREREIKRERERERKREREREDHLMMKPRHPPNLLLLFLLHSRPWIRVRFLRRLNI
jgi:hypothetical protein